METTTNQTEIKTTFNVADLLPPMLKPYAECMVSRGIMFIGGVAVIFKYDDEKKEFYLDLITSVLESRGSGEASFVLKHICEQADLNGVTMSLIPDNTFSKGIGLPSLRDGIYKIASKKKGRLSMKALVSWYERNGFVKGDGKLMIRTPRVM